MRLASILLVCAGIAAAQTTPPKPLSIGGVTVTGSFRERLEVWDWFQPDSGDNTYPYSGSILRLGFSKKLEKYDWNVELAVPFVLGLPDNPTAPGAQGALGFGGNYFTANGRSKNAGMAFAKQMYIRFTPTKNQALKLGRFEFSDGSELTPKNGTLAAVKAARVTQRLIGNFGFSHVGRSLDGMQYSYTTPKGNFTFMGAVPTRGVFQVDGWGWNRVALGYASYTKPWGTKTHAAETRLFSLYYDDFRPIVKTDSRPAAVKAKDLQNIRIQTYGGHTLHSLDTKRATFDFLLWGAAQTGSWGVQSHRAFAIDAEAGYQPKLMKGLKPWLRGGFSLGSGDDNPNDATHGTFFQVIPTPRPFARMPFFNMMNNRDAFGILILRPHPKVTTNTEFHALGVANSNDLWYSGGGVFQPWTFGYTGRATSGRKSLANLWDTSVEYRYNSKFTFTGYIGYAQGRAITSTIYPKGPDGRFGYMEVTYKF